jgi:predicted Zn-dependent protease
MTPVPLGEGWGKGLRLRASFAPDPQPFSQTEKGAKKIKMAVSRIEVFEQMLASDPANAVVLFGLAKEYEKSGDDAKVIDTLERYLASADDEGNAYGMLARAYERTNQPTKAREAYERGVNAATSHGHPGMAQEYREILEAEFAAS